MCQAIKDTLGVQAIINKKVPWFVISSWQGKEGKFKFFKGESFEKTARVGREIVI